jgi:hypothetical protein
VCVPLLYSWTTILACFGKTKSNDSECVPLLYSYDEASTWTTILSWPLFWENKEQQVWEISEPNTGAWVSVLTIPENYEHKSNQSI